MTERINRETKRKIIAKLKRLKAMPLLYEITRNKYKRAIESERSIFHYKPFYNVWEDTLMNLVNYNYNVELDGYINDEICMDNYIMFYLNTWKKYLEKEMHISN